MGKMRLLRSRSLDPEVNREKSPAPEKGDDHGPEIVKDQDLALEKGLNDRVQETGRKGPAPGTDGAAEVDPEIGEGLDPGTTNTRRASMGEEAETEMKETARKRLRGTMTRRRWDTRVEIKESRRRNMRRWTWRYLILLKFEIRNKIMIPEYYLEIANSLFAHEISCLVILYLQCGYPGVGSDL